MLPVIPLCCINREPHLLNFYCHATVETTINTRSTVSDGNLGIRLHCILMEEFITIHSQPAVMQSENIAEFFGFGYFFLFKSLERVVFHSQYIHIIWKCRYMWMTCKEGLQIILFLLKCGKTWFKKKSNSSRGGKIILFMYLVLYMVECLKWDKYFQSIYQLKHNSKCSFSI